MDPNQVTSQKVKFILESNVKSNESDSEEKMLMQCREYE